MTATAAHTAQVTHTAQSVPVAPFAPAAGDRQPQLRPVARADAAAMARYLQGLGAESRRLRFHGGINPGSPRLLQHLTDVDGRQHIALVAVLPCDDGDLVVGEARCVRGAEVGPAEFAISVADAWQGRGLAQPLMRALLAAAAQAGVAQVVGDVLAGNARMAGFMQREGFVTDTSAEPGVVRWMRDLAVPAGVAGSGAVAGRRTGWVSGWAQFVDWTRGRVRGRQGLAAA